MPEAHVAGAAMTRFGRRPEPLEALAKEAAEAALDLAGNPRVDHLFVASQGPEELAGVGHLSTRLATALGLAGIPATRIESAPSSGASAVEAAWFAVRSGLVETALVVGVEKMTHVPTEERTRVLARMMSPEEQALGLTMPALAALSTRAYLHRYGLEREALAAVPVKAHAHGVLHERAQFRKKVTVEEVLASPVIADPLRLYDCAPVTDGAAAVVLTSHPAPVRVAGMGHATDAQGLANRQGEDALTSFRATRVAGAQAFDRAGLRAGDVDVAELHDAFSVLELLALEDLGFYPVGQSLEAVERGEVSLGGVLPANVGGGLKARGHPVGATGVAQVVELWEQLTACAGRRQVDGARVGLAQNVGGFGNNNVVTLLEVAQ